MKERSANCLIVSQILFTLPLYFQVVVLDSPSRAGLRLVISSLATPIGGVVAGIVSRKPSMLTLLIWTGFALVVLGNVLLITLSMNEPGWKYIVFLIPANLGQGIAYPSILFRFIGLSQQCGKCSISNDSTTFDLARINALKCLEHAVATSVVYLFRSLGTVWGVAATATMVQFFLSRNLATALVEVPNREEVGLHFISCSAMLPIPLPEPLVNRNTLYNREGHPG